MNFAYQYVYLAGTDGYYTASVDGIVRTSIRNKLGRRYVLAQKSGSGNRDWLDKLESGTPVGSSYVRIAHMSISSYPRVSYSTSGTPSTRDSFAGWGTWWLEDGYTDVSPPSSLTQRAATIAAFNYYSEIDKLAGSFEGFTFLGEFPKTLSSLSYRLTALHTGARVASRKLNNRLRRLQRKYRGKLTDSERLRLRTSLSGYYLEYWFGIFPLAMSIAGLDDAFNQPPTVRVQGRASVVNAYMTTYQISHNADAVVDVGVLTKEILSCEYTGFYSASLFDNLSLRLGFTQDDLALTAWELIPFSWAADYWLRVTDYLTSRKYSRFAPILCFRSDRYQRFRSIATVKGNVKKPGHTATGSSVDPRARCRSVRLTRSVVQAPRLSFSSVLDLGVLKDGPSQQQQSYLVAVGSVLTKRMRHLTKLL